MIIGAIWITIIILMVILMIRNNRVAKYRLEVINKMSHGAQRDILGGKDWAWRSDIYNSVSYDEMLLKFWRNLDSFYPDKSFMQ